MGYSRPPWSCAWVPTGNGTEVPTLPAPVPSRGPRRLLLQWAPRQLPPSTPAPPLVAGRPVGCLAVTLAVRGILSGHQSCSLARWVWACCGWGRAVLLNHHHVPRPQKGSDWPAPVVLAPDWPLVIPAHQLCFAQDCGELGRALCPLRGCPWSAPRCTHRLPPAPGPDLLPFTFSVLMEEKQSGVHKVE